MTSIHFASISDDISLVNYIHSKGGNINYRDKIVKILFFLMEKQPYIMQLMKFYQIWFFF